MKKAKSSAIISTSDMATTNKSNATNEKKKSNEETEKQVDERKDSFEEQKNDKLKRPNSFNFSRTFSKIYTKLSGSKESLNVDVKDNKISEKPEVTTFKFQRSLTLNSIQMKKSYKNSFTENRLEKLTEEKICDDVKTKSPASCPVEIVRSTYRQSMPPGSFDNVDYSLLKPQNKLERSASFISLIRRKISSTESAPLNSNWATSLQQIDNMVSYEDLSFVDYDKFNQYEQQNKRMLIRQQTKEAKERKLKDALSTTAVVRRRSKMSADFNSNLDEEKNLYRQSIDSRKLRFLSTIYLDSRRCSKLGNESPTDLLSLENSPSRSTM